MQGSLLLRTHTFFFLCCFVLAFQGIIINGADFERNYYIWIERVRDQHGRGPYMGS